MNISRAKEEIKNTVRAYLAKDEKGRPLIETIKQRPVLLIGPPGIGKTAIMEQIARECKIGLAAYTMTHHTRQSAMGLPFIEKKTYDGEEYSVTSYTMSEIIASVHNIIENTGLKEGILFIDEINCVSETLSPVMLQFLQAKMFGNSKVPEGWIIVAAGNPPEYNKSVREFDIVTLDRVKYISIEPDYNTWKEYAVNNGIHICILSYLNARQENFYRIETTVDGKRFATARGWEDLSDMIKASEKLKLPIDAQVVEQYIQHPEVSVDFANYLSLYYKYEKEYSIDDILNGEVSTAVYNRISKASFDEKVSVVSLILGTLNKKFREYFITDMVTASVFDKLKMFQKEENMSFESVIKEFTQQYSKNKMAGLLDADVLESDSRVLDIFITYSDLIREDAGCRALRTSGDKYGEISKELHQKEFEIVSAEFMKLSDEREEVVEKVGKYLENAFDFSEKSYGVGPEMVLFVTELAAGMYSLTFIQENGCERFYKYNKSMLRDVTRSQLVDEINGEN